MPQDATAPTSNLIPIGFKTRLDDKLKLVLDSMPIGITWARLDDGSIAYANRRFTEMLGYTLEDIPTITAFYEAVYDDPQDLAAAKAGSAHVFGHNNLQQMEFPSLEVTVRCKDGKYKTVALGLVVLPEVGWMVATYLDLSDRKERERLIEKLAEEDPLTGLLNRRSFDAAVAERLATRAEDETVLMLVLDLDGFKHINDTRGHEFGDRVLRTAAQTLAQVFRGHDRLARIGGDEFAAVLKVRDGDEAVSTLPDRIAAAFQAPTTIDGEAVAVGISVGSARCPADARDAFELYRLADAAMYRNKKARKAVRR